MDKFILQKSEVITQNKESMIEDIRKAHAFFCDRFRVPDTESTWMYGWYNAFSITAPSSEFYELYKELCTMIRNFINTDEQLWFTCWINWHMPDEVLDWHDHVSEWHGFISIEPHKTETIWRDGFKVDNEVGNIFIGTGQLDHKVVVLENFDTPRITLGFDIVKDIKDTCSVVPCQQFNLMPIL